MEINQSKSSYSQTFDALFSGGAAAGEEARKAFAPSGTSQDRVPLLTQCNCITSKKFMRQYILVAIVLKMAFKTPDVLIDKNCDKSDMYVCKK